MTVIASSDITNSTHHNYYGTGSAKLFPPAVWQIFPAILACTGMNLSKRPSAKLVIEQLAVNLLSVNMIQIKIGVVEYSYVLFVMM